MSSLITWQPISSKKHIIKHTAWIVTAFTLAHSITLTATALDLEMLAEAGRNVKVAKLLRDADTQARNRMRQLLISERSVIKGIDEVELESRINVIFSVMAGLLLRKVLYPELTEETVLIALF